MEGERYRHASILIFPDRTRDSARRAVGMQGREPGDDLAGEVRVRWQILGEDRAKPE
jgi:hypothetical protein